MGAGLGLFQLVLRPPGDYVLLVADEVADQFLKAHLHRLAAGDRHDVDAECGLKVGILVQKRQRLFRVRVALEFDHRPHAGAVGLVPDVVDAAEQRLFLLAEL
ncbi:hypothetical protein SDC9_191852 [bioreactor metagenome]|uniref:Uncharacterized protein n=1 Tax=bioreactor metagenome TaxID=1076179 RepID=A0A645HZE6_9ZZZZ